jgi:hypothetical protein
MSMLSEQTNNRQNKGFVLVEFTSICCPAPTIEGQITMGIKVPHAMPSRRK